MKHVLTSTGLLALGAISLHALDPEMTRQQTGRPFSLSATVRGFYDDNVNTAPNKEQDSFGFEVSPSVHLNLPLEQTFISLGYVYSLKWFDDREPDIDQSHEFNGKLRHQFSPRHAIGVDDRFVVTSEPTVAESGGIITAPTRQRSKSSVFHNVGSIEDNIGLTPTLALSLGYVNSWFDYQDRNIAGSRSALLDRMDHSFRGDVRYQFHPKLVGLVGYTFGINDYTGDEFLDATRTAPGDLKSDIRDSYSHRAYLGADYDITAKLRASARVGVEYTDYHERNENSLSPYADASMTYVFAPGSALEVGVRHSRSATDVALVDGSGRPTLDAETTALFAQFSHRITHALTASLVGQYQMSTFHEGANDGREEDMWLLGANMEYRFNRHWSTEVGYNYDLLDSDIENRGYHRNRVYVGVRATY